MRIYLAAVLFFLPQTSLAQAPPLGLKVPAGFEVVEFADGKLANDIHCMTIDPEGRVLVSGRGYLRILVDDDGDGRADRAIDFAAEPKDGAMGLLWEKDALFVMGDGGLRRFTTGNNPLQPDGPSELVRAMKTGGEHSSHAIRRGPDGCLYLLCGNNAGIDRSYAEMPTSPIQEPTAGCILRLDPSSKKSAIVSHGFRNPYSMDFNLDGELFTFDSDNERCVSLPWYEPTRFYHVIEGGHYGWLNPQHAAFWRRPPYFFDVVPPIATLGRGSPTGVACYGHNQFPIEFQGGFFLCDWTFGKIHYASLKRQGMTYACQTKVFLESQGENGFAPTACAVDPVLGDLYISIGGRGTRGGVYRIRHTEGFRKRTELKSLAILPRSTPKQRPPGEHPISRERGLGLIEAQDPKERLEGIRTLQLAFGDIGARKSLGTIWEGYTARQPISDDGAGRKLANRFPDADPDVNRELARTLGMLGFSNDTLRWKVLQRCDKDSSPVDDIHFLACYACLGGKRRDEEANRVADILLDLDRKITAKKLNRDSNWPLRVQELYLRLAQADGSLARTMVESPSFGRPDHALFANSADFPKRRAAQSFLDRWRKDVQYPLTGNIIQVFETLPPADLLPTMRQRWGETGQETALLPLLAREPQPQDRAKFLDGLNSTQDAILKACVHALDQLDLPTDANESFGLIRALHRATTKQLALRTILAQRLTKTTGQAFGADNERWFAWLQREYPELGKRLANPDGVDVARWQARLSQVDWDLGKANAGKAVFSKASCITCHSGSQALGPDLIGVTNRFSRADLLTAIIQPSKDVPARYQTTMIETRDGKAYQGIVIYDAVDSLILQTGAATTVRLDGSQVSHRSISAQSLMPAGLLDPLRDQEIADLYAYLRSLGQSRN